MATLLQSVLRQLSSAPAEAGSDADLLRRFADGQDHAAFAVLVQRHGGLVWGVCKQMVPSEADAEDAFQAVFLVLVRNTAAALRSRALGGWLHGVAVKVCLKARRTEARKRKREERGAKPETVSEPDLLGPDWADLHAAVHEEVRKLPDAHRTAFVLCDLQGVRQHDAATRLGWKIGTLTGRLARARQQLMKRLTARGLAPAVGVGLTAGLSAPPALADKVLSLTTGQAIPIAVLNLSKHILEGTLMKMKLLAATVLTATALTLGVGGWLATADAQPPGGARGGGGGQPGIPPGFGSGEGGGVLPGEPGRPGTGMPGMGGSAGSAAKPQPRVEHALVDTPNTEKELQALFNQRQADGWEFAGSIDRTDLKIDYRKLAFKRPTAKAGTGFNPLGVPLDVGSASGGTPGGTAPRTGGMGMPAPGMTPGMPGPGALRPTPGASLPGAGAGDGEGGLPAKAETDLSVIRLRNAAAADLATALGQLFKGTDATIVAEPSSNTLLVRASPKTLKELIVVIEKIDGLERPVPPGGSGGPGGPGGRPVRR